VPFVNMQLTVAIGVRVDLYHCAAARETNERYHIDQREISQRPARSSCLHPGSEERLHRCTEIDELKRLLKKLECAIHAAFTGHLWRDSRSDDENAAGRKYALQFFEKGYRARMGRIKIENDQFRLSLDRNRSCSRQRTGDMGAMLRREFL